MRIGLFVLFVMVMLVGIAHVWSKFLFEKYANSLIVTALGSVGVNSGLPVDAEALPELVQNLAKQSGADPNQLNSAVRFRQSAELRMTPDSPWKTLKTEQVITLTKPGFVWFAEQKSGPFTILQVVDAYLAGEGLLKARLFGFVPVANVSGEGIARGELMRYLAELAWAPDAIYLNPHLHWIKLADNTIKVEADSVGGSVSVRLYFDRQGDLVEIQTDAREAIEGGKTISRPWRGFFSDYREIGNRRIPVKAEVGYIYENGYAAYFRGEIVEYEVVRQ